MITAYGRVTLFFVGPGLVYIGPGARSALPPSVLGARHRAICSGTRAQPSRELHPATPSTRLRAGPHVRGVERVHTRRCPNMRK